MSTLALHGLSMDNAGVHYKDALRLGTPFHLDATYIRKRSSTECAA